MNRSLKKEINQIEEMIRSLNQSVESLRGINSRNGFVVSTSRTDYVMIDFIGGEQSNLLPVPLMDASVFDTMFNNEMSFIVDYLRGLGQPAVIMSFSAGCDITLLNLEYEIACWTRVKEDRIALYEVYKEARYGKRKSKKSQQQEKDI